MNRPSSNVPTPVRPPRTTPVPPPTPVRDGQANAAQHTCMRCSDVARACDSDLSPRSAKCHVTYPIDGIEHHEYPHHGASYIRRHFPVRSVSATQTTNSPRAQPPSRSGLASRATAHLPALLLPLRCAASVLHSGSTGLQRLCGEEGHR